MQQTFPETSLAFAADADDAAVQILHIAIGAHPGILLLKHIKAGLPQLPRGCNQLGAGLGAILDEDEGETHEVRYSALQSPHSQRKYTPALSAYTIFYKARTAW